jgi:RimJ/RimL family protein N-acetyltransferase
MRVSNGSGSDAQPAELRGPRVTLAPLTVGHLDCVRVWRSDPEVTRYWISRRAPTEAEVREWFQHNQAPGTLTWVILDETAVPIGYVNLFAIDDESRRAELALMIGERRVWGHGYAREALRALLTHVFAERGAGGLGLHKIYLSVFAANLAARRVYAACGFREDGILREDMYRDGAWHDQVLMSVLAREFRQAAGRDDAPTTYREREQG